MSECYNCGRITTHHQVYPVDPELSRLWRLNDGLSYLFNRREGNICDNCGVNARANGLALAIIRSKFGLGAKSLNEWVRLANKSKLKVCELNSCHELHATLKGLEGLTYSEYGTTSEQNIEALSYGSESFDLVLHSETLEHVNNPSAAMTECRRVLKKNGLVLFTVPVIWDRKTLRRAVRSERGTDYLLSPSYHGKQTDDYLVVHEFGHDISKLTGAVLAMRDFSNQNFVFASDKESRNISFFKLASLYINQKIYKSRKPVNA